mgnify:CR=1 FL=1
MNFESSERRKLFVLRIRFFVTRVKRIELCDRKEIEYFWKKCLPFCRFSDKRVVYSWMKAFVVSERGSNLRSKIGYVFVMRSSKSTLVHESRWWGAHFCRNIPKLLNRLFSLTNSYVTTRCCVQSCMHELLMLLLYAMDDSDRNTRVLQFACSKRNPACRQGASPIYLEWSGVAIKETDDGRCKKEEKGC